MKFKTFQFFCLMVLFVFSIFICGSAFAADPDQDSDQEQEEETSAFQNPTQAQRAINVANAYAEKPDPELEKALNKVQEKEKALADAEKALKDAELEGDEDDIEKKEQARDFAQQELDDAKQEADDHMAENAGVTPEDVEQMREDGMGWGQIAHELGLHPSVMGMRHAKAYKEKEARSRGFGPDGKVSDKEIKDATARNFKSGLSKGHGQGADKGDKSKNGNGLGKGKDKSESKAGGSSNKGGKGNGGGKGGSKK